MTDKLWYYQLFVGGPLHGTFSDEWDGDTRFNYGPATQQSVYRSKPLAILYHKSLDTPEARNLALLSIEGVEP